MIIITLHYEGSIKEEDNYSYMKNSIDLYSTNNLIYGYRYR